MRALVCTAIVVGALSGAGCGKAPTSGSHDELTAAIARGRAVWEAEECAACHGEDRGGTVIGPSLEGVDEHWRREELERFLVDPTAALDDNPRLAAMTDRYQVDMPGVQRADATEVTDLATFLIHGDD
jgi:cytochrome c2